MSPTTAPKWAELRPPFVKLPDYPAHKVLTAYLDVTAILNDPGILDVSHPAIVLRITHSVVTAIESLDDLVPENKEVQIALRRVIAERRIIADPDLSRSEPKGDQRRDGITDNEFMIIMMSAIASEDRSCVVTDDPVIAARAWEEGVVPVRPAEYRRFAAGLHQRDVAKRQHLNWYFRVGAIGQILSAILAILFLLIILVKFDTLLTLFTAIGAIIVVSVLGPLLYAIRGRARLFYGLLEVAVGFITPIWVLSPFISEGEPEISEWLAVPGLPHYRCCDSLQHL